MAPFSGLIPKDSLNALTQPLIEKRAAADSQDWTGSFTSGVDLIAMVVSDSGLADVEPQWCNCSPLGCFLIGLQPRGGWQVMQRAVQWGSDSWTNAFGVNCTDPVLYAFFTCSMRNRIEVWNSDRFWSPMENVAEGGPWNGRDGFSIKRPTKLLDGSRGGQAFVCDILRPADGKHYSIKQQAHAQLLSVVLVAAALTDESDPDKVQQIIEDDFGLHTKLGPVFKRLLWSIIPVNAVALFFVSTVFGAMWHRNYYRGALPYMIKVASLFNWAVGAIGLLMLGGNPRVTITTREMPKHVTERLDALGTVVVETDGSDYINATGNIDATKLKLDPEQVLKNELGVVSITEVPPTPLGQKVSEDDPVTLHFGSLHGSVYTPDQGQCRIPLRVVRRICTWDIKQQRLPSWYCGIIWFGSQLLVSIVIQIIGSRFTVVGAEAMSILILLITALARGTGLSGSEEWMIPRWKRRKNTSAGALLLGKIQSRQ